LSEEGFEQLEKEIIYIGLFDDKIHNATLKKSIVANKRKDIAQSRLLQVNEFVECGERDCALVSVKYPSRLLYVCAGENTKTFNTITIPPLCFSII
jgi:hypothetical protein